MEAAPAGNSSHVTCALQLAGSLRPRSDVDSQIWCPRGAPCADDRCRCVQARNREHVTARYYSPTRVSKQQRHPIRSNSREFKRARSSASVQGQVARGYMRLARIHSSSTRYVKQRQRSPQANAWTGLPPVCRSAPDLLQAIWTQLPE